MRVHHIASLTLAVALGVAVCAALPAAAQKKSRTADRFWTSSELASLPVASIAMLPVVTFDGNLEARKAVEQHMGQSLRGSGHRWVSATTAREYLRRAGGDSLLSAIADAVLKHERIDSLDAPFICQSARARAVLLVRVDQYEQRKLEFNQSGNPATTVQLKAALVDSTGRLLWSASGGETLEGPYQDARESAVGVKASGLNNTPMTNQGGAPTFAETLTKLFARWGPEFPRTPAAAAPE